MSVLNINTYYENTLSPAAIAGMIDPKRNVGFEATLSSSPIKVPLHLQTHPYGGSSFPIDGYTVETVEFTSLFCLFIINIR